MRCSGIPWYTLYIECQVPWYIGCDVKRCVMNDTQFIVAQQRALHTGRHATFAININIIII